MSGPVFPTDDLPSGRKVWYIGATDNLQELLSLQNLLGNMGWEVSFGMGASDGPEWGFAFTAFSPGKKKAVEIQTNETIPDYTKTQFKPRIRWGYPEKKRPEATAYFATPAQLKELIDGKLRDFVMA